MSYVCKAEANPVTDRKDLVIGIADKEFGRFHGIFHRVDGFIFLSVYLSLGFFVAPNRFHFLNVRRITQHDVTKACSRVCGDDLALESIVIQLGQHSRVIDVRMRQEDEINFRRGNRQIRIHKAVYTLFHSAVDQEFLLANLQEMTASCHFMIGSDKH